ncbi:predicted protein [Botrytis cinerea T4]|uniref:Uncharacterized protein n=1 Tax=Botryotinia fuckeliana (strain T4) TaxID=999810 RepID=G2YKZ2_BOTF4|nr:predicted protein [Botrytis cinerea T4]
MVFKSEICSDPDMDRTFEIIVVEVTESGRPLYESEGFQYIDRWETRLPPQVGEQR